MLKTGLIQGILFDYGGTIDSNGRHWSEVIWEAYQKVHLPVTKEAFREAYVYAERFLAKHPVIQPHFTFLDMLRAKSSLQVDWLRKEKGLDEVYATAAIKEQIAQDCHAMACEAVRRARPVLLRLHAHYPLVLVSNFYGNIQAVLAEMGLTGLFRHVIESAVVGVRKPDPAIFQLGIDALGIRAEETVVVGDSYDKDIVPAHALGCRTVWLKNTGWQPYRGDEEADVVIHDFPELEKVLLPE